MLYYKYPIFSSPVLSYWSFIAGSPSGFARAGGMDVFLAMLADKDGALRKVFQNLNVDEQYVFYYFAILFFWQL